MAEVREGCALLIEKVRRHIGDAALLAAGGRLEGASLFVLLGFEESGKLLYLLQSAAEAEAAGADRVTLEAFADHTGKAAVTSEYISRVIDLILWASRQAGVADESLGGYLDHLTAVGKGFMDLRARAMFIDYVNGTWTRGRAVSLEFLQGDSLCLAFLTSSVEEALGKYSSFRDLVASFKSLDQELRKNLPRLFQEIIRISSSQSATPQ